MSDLIDTLPAIPPEIESVSRFAQSELVEYMADLHAMDDDDPHKHFELVAWARSPMWHPALMICEGNQGAIARAAYRAYQRDLDADTPARRWWDADRALGRASICRMLNVGAGYSTEPFRTIIIDDVPYIGAAIGCMPAFDASAIMRWCHLDIRDVLLWSPRTGDVWIDGEHASSRFLVIPDSSGRDDLTVYTDPLSFFRAWAALRADKWQFWASNRHAHPCIESADGGLPGVLAIGGVVKQPWARCEAQSLIAAPCVDPDVLRRAVIAAYCVPTVKGVASAHVR